MACWRSVESSLRSVVPLFLALTISDAAAFAETRSAEHAGSSQTSEAFAQIIDEASRRFGLPVHWIRAVLEVESARDVCAKSSKGAMGLMQIMPQTWAELRLRYQLGNDPYDPHDNILAGAAYLRELHNRYGSPGFLAAYNAGPARYEEHLAGRALSAETRAYLQKLAPAIGSDISVPGAVARLQPSEATLFVVRSESLKSTTSAQRGLMLDQTPFAGAAQGISAIVPQATGLFSASSVAGGRP